MSLASQSVLKSAFAQLRSNFMATIFFSMFINLLMFVGPIYMLQVYDRILTSRSEVTLVVITALAVGLLVVYGLLESVRSRILVRTGIKFDDIMGQQVFRSVFTGQIRAPGGAYSQAVRDLDSLREFLSGGAIIAFCDAPWVPVFLAVGFMLHPWLGMVSLVGAVIIFILALMNEFTTRKLLAEGGNHSVAANQYVQSSMRNAEAVHAMGMMPGMLKRWVDRHAHQLSSQSRASDRAGMILACSKFVRMGLQVAVLGVGAYLVLLNEISPGAMIAASIIMGRALAPVEMAVSQWKGFVGARSAHGRLKKMFESIPTNVERMRLPNPVGNVKLEQVMAVAPGTRNPIVKNVNAEFNPGEIIGIVGPSGSGKSSLARILVGVWPVVNGHVRLDGADLHTWDPDLLGPHMGYLPQDVELFAGSVAENIARFGEIDPDKVVLAAQNAGVHDLILQLPQGYDTKIGDGGQSLSGGQRQRIALARALYGSPRVIVLDEPNASLDSEGDAALAKALAGAKKDGSMVVVVTHKTSLLSSVDKMMVMKDGTVTMFGPRDAVLKELNKPKTAAAAPKMPQVKTV